MNRGTVQRKLRVKLKRAHRLYFVSDPLCVYMKLTLNGPERRTFQTAEMRFLRIVCVCRRKSVNIDSLEEIIRD
jgi:hypothetical protein